MTAGKASVVPTLPSVPAGAYFLDLKVIPASAVVLVGRAFVVRDTPVVGFGSLALEITAPARLGKLVLDKPVTGVATVQGAGADARLRLRAVDNLERLIGQAETAVHDGANPFRLPTIPACSIMARLEAELVVGQDTTDAQELSYSLTDFYPDPTDLRHVVWTSPSNDSISPYVLREFRIHGVDTQYTNFNELIPLADMWHIPYVTRFVDAKTDWYQVRSRREKGDLVRDPCLTSPNYLEELTGLLTRNAEQVSKYSTLDFSLGDECMFVSGNWDLCMSPTCNADFRAFLKREYGDLAQVNAEWGSDYKTWEEVVPLTLPEAREQGRLPQWVDHRRHMESVWAGIYGYSREVIRKQVPPARVGYEGSDTQVGSFHAADYWKLSQVMDFNNIYYRDFLSGAVRDFAPANMLLGAGWYGGYAGCRNEPFMRWFPWRALFKGSNSLWIWMGYGTAGSVMGFDLSLYPFYQVNCEEVNQIKAGPAKLLLASQRQHDGIAVLWSASSVHAAHITDGFPAMDATLTSLARIIHDIGLEYQTVSYAQLAEGKVTRDRFKVLVLPGTQALARAEAAAVQAFVAAGGTVIADLRPGVCDEHAKPYPTGALDELFGVKQDPAKFAPTSGDLTTADGVVLKRVTADTGLTVTAADTHQKLGTTPVLVTRKHPRGQTVLLNFSLASYAEAERLEAEKGDFGGWPTGAAARALMTQVLAAGGVMAPVSITPALPQVEVNRFTSGLAEYIGIVQSLPRDGAAYTNRRATWPGATPVTIGLSREAHVYDVRAGRYLGRVHELKTEIRPGVAKLYALLPYAVSGVGGAVTGPVSPGEAVRYEVGVEIAAGTPVTHCLRVEVVDPQGTARECYAANVLAPQGSARGEFVTALNDPPGKWTVRLRDVASGAAGQMTFELRAR